MACIIIYIARKKRWGDLKEKKSFCEKKKKKKFVVWGPRRIFAFPAQLKALFVCFPIGITKGSAIKKMLGYLR